MKLTALMHTARSPRARVSIIVIAIAIVIFVLAIVVNSSRREIPAFPRPETTFWKIQSIDTMKYSRDLAREKNLDDSFDIEIERQMRAISETGATHVAIATPYDHEFLPILNRWVAAARRHGLSIWFRGGWSGWEGWFDYPEIGEPSLFQNTERFIVDNEHLFQHEDIFEPCPECENGVLGDPRATGNVSNYRTHLIQLNDVAKGAFKKIKKGVTTGVFSMNGDVAKLIMDRGTVESLDGLVSIDHYVSTADRLAADTSALSESTGGLIILSEFGAPIPDIHGSMSADEQAAWIEDNLDAILPNERLLGINYWVNVGGSTALWNSDGTARAAVSVLNKYFTPESVFGAITDEIGAPISSALVTTGERTFTTGRNGYYALPILAERETELTIAAPGYLTRSVAIATPGDQLNVVLKREHESLFFKLKKLIAEQFKK